MSGVNYNPNKQGNSFVSNPSKRIINRFYDNHAHDYNQDEDYKAIEKYDNIHLFLVLIVQMKD